jgi:hypothetical protein
MSKNAIKKLTIQLNEALETYILEVVVPGLQHSFQAELGLGPELISVDSNSPSDVYIRYPTSIVDRPGYIVDNVKIEFGGKNATEPSEQHLVATYLAEGGYGVDLPTARPNVLSPQRTFWEKATLAHAECNRPEIRSGAERISRHWYDLHQLANGPIGRGALSNRELLEDVVRVKSLFYNTSSASFADCLSGKLRLVPNTDGQETLRGDYEKMVNAQMIDGDVPDFDDILNQLSELEGVINQS